MTDVATVSIKRPALDTWNNSGTSTSGGVGVECGTTWVGGYSIMFAAGARLEPTSDRKTMLTVRFDKAKPFTSFAQLSDSGAVAILPGPWVKPSDWPKDLPFPERGRDETVNYLSELLAHSTMLIQFSPLLDDARTLSFDLTGLQEEMARHPECPKLPPPTASNP